MSDMLIILDRDGVINHDSDEFIKSEAEWLPIQSSLSAIAKLNHAGYKVAIATNQSGIGRGYFDLVTLTLIHKKMQLELAKVGAQIDALEFCPDHPDTPGPDRKPNTGMIKRLLNKFEVEACDTWFVGDSISDIECAQRSGCKPALVLTGKGKITSKLLTSKVAIFKDLEQYVDHLLIKNNI